MGWVHRRRWPSLLFSSCCEQMTMAVASPQLKAVGGIESNKEVEPWGVWRERRLHNYPCPPHPSDADVICRRATIGLVLR